MNNTYLDFEKSDPAEIRKWQWEKIAESLKRAAQTKFYKQLYRKYKFDIAKVRNFDDFEKIPFTTEDDLRQHARDFLAIPLSKVWRIFATSGTTGKPKLIFREQLNHESEILSVFHHLFKRAGFFPKIAAVMRPAGGLGASGPVAAKVMELMEIPCFTVSPEADFKKSVMALHEIKPDLLIISPSFAAVLIGQLKKEGIPPRSLNVEKIITTGEALHPNERRYIESEFGADIINTYGAADPSVWLGSECGARHGLHFFPYTSYIELMSPEGKITEGTGELVVTPFSNHAMPLIRYKLGDIAVMDHEKAVCGCELPRFITISRTEKPLVFEIGGQMIELEIKKLMDKVISDFPQVSSFFNFVFDRSESLIEITFEADEAHLTAKDIKAIPAKIEKKFLEQSKVLAELAGKRAVTISVSIVPLGTLYREAAKLKNQIIVR